MSIGEVNCKMMNLERLREFRDSISTKEFPISDAELCARYEQLYTGAVNDVMRELTLLNQVFPNNIMPLRDEMKVAGIAFTIKSAKNPTFAGEMDTRAKMLDSIHDDCICVWDTSGDNDSAQWGEVMTAASKKRGARGAVIDGGIRDTHQILAQDFPVFYRYRTSNGTLARSKIIDYQVPVDIGGLIIRPGDIIFGDIDGVLVVPRDIAYEVLLRAEEIKEGEKEINKWVQSGMKAQDVIDRGGYF